MTATLVEPAVAPGPGRGATGRRRLPKRSTLLIAAFLLLAVAVVALTSGGPERSGRLDPDNPGLEGARAIARVLAAQGVDVTVVRSADELAAQALHTDTTVVVTSTDNLGTSTADQLRRQAGDARIVLVDPSTAVLRVFDVAGYATAADARRPIPADCTSGGFADLQIDVDQATAMPIDGCFGDTVSGFGRLVLLGAGDLLTNDQVKRADNAAVGLRLLGGSDRLVWYVASSDDLVAEDGVSLSSLLPAWIGPGLFLLLLVGAGLVVWRARRLGPLASEPLPVVVRAIETTHSRGRLYRRSGDRGHAARTLRAAARARVVSRLGLDRTVDDATLIRDVARHVGRPEHEVGALLSTANIGPGSDRDLIRLANDLAALVREVRRT